MKRRDFLLGAEGVVAEKNIPAKSEDEYVDLVNRAHEGDVASMVTLGDMYSLGAEDLQEDQNEAYICYYLAAKKGHSQAQDSVNEFEAQLTQTEIQKLQQDAENYGCGALALDGCFITTAVYEGLGERDECEELRTLRHFRDTVLLKQDNGREIICEYYRMAPMIVQAIEQSALREKIYAEILENYLLPAIRQIRSKDYEAAYHSYRQMVEQLSAKYL